MTSRRGSHALDPAFIGHIRIQPALNEAERAHLCALVDCDGTLRGTPTGRGDRSVPFAHLAWEVCSGGCCLTWNPDLESSAMMLPTLRFVIEHLLGPGARAQGRPRFEEFTFDHVLDGAVMGQRYGDREVRLVEVAANVASERVLPACDRAAETSLAGRPTRRRRLPSNVIEFRPRRA